MLRQWERMTWMDRFWAVLSCIHLDSIVESHHRRRRLRTMCRTSLIHKCININVYTVYVEYLRQTDKLGWTNSFRFAAQQPIVERVEMLLNASFGEFFWSVCVTIVFMILVWNCRAFVLRIIALVNFKLLLCICVVILQFSFDFSSSCRLFLFVLLAILKDF